MTALRRLSRQHRGGREVNHSTTKPAHAEVDLVSLIDRTDPEQRAIAFAILKARQKRKAAEIERKRGHR